MTRYKHPQCGVNRKEEEIEACSYAFQDSDLAVHQFKARNCYETFRPKNYKKDKKLLDQNPILSFL